LHEFPGRVVFRIKDFSNRIVQRSTLRGIPDLPAPTQAGTGSSPCAWKKPFAKRKNSLPNCSNFLRKKHDLKFPVEANRPLTGQSLTVLRDHRLIHVYDGKTAQSDRRIPMNDILFEVLANLSQRRKSDFVFPSHRKSGDRFRDPKVGFMKAIRLAGISKFRFHDLRLTFATRLVRAGVDLITVQHLLGHATITMTTRYAHSLADYKIAAVWRLDFAGVCSSPDPNRTPAPISNEVGEGRRILPASTIAL